MSQLYKRLYLAGPPTWGPGFIQAVKVIRVIHNTGLRETLDIMANQFGFEDWEHWQPWLREAKVDWTNIRGPHAMTLLRMLAIKHERNVSTGR